ALGLILRQKGELEESARELRLSVTERPGDAQGHNVLGTVLVRLGDIEGAVEEFRQATRLDPRSIEAHVNLAQALRKTDRDEETQAALATAQRLKEEEAGLGRAMVLVGMASGQIDKGERAAAVANLRDAVAAAPDFGEAHYRLGLALSKTASSSAEAEDSLLRAVQLEPDHATYRYEWARLLAEKGDTTAALDQLRRAAALQPSLADAHRELGRLALRSRDWGEAAKALRAALVWRPDDASLRRDLAAALDGLGESGEAARERAAAIKLERTKKPN
ncbi:MAG TPA: tetratricopeptide repeat protein, partial [Vicinamibacteria bacterium]